MTRQTGDYAEGSQAEERMAANPSHPEMAAEIS